MTETTIPNRTAALHALPAGTIIRNAATCGGDSIIDQFTINNPDGTLRSRMAICAADFATSPCSEMLENDGCWPWLTEDADGDLDDPERLLELTIVLPEGATR